VAVGGLGAHRQRGIQQQHTLPAPLQDDSRQADVRRVQKIVGLSG
jgi:hypothetical protein